ncbi:hypothetical protein [Patulibacter minatonensis]|uniref:hypothetical protein n=1 Tax=Patulibacter minatonensis TaxID=298163 RepID=UPI00047D708E|nr:hypothetical protein [Patulibacter minatonensis]
MGERIFTELEADPQGIVTSMRARLAEIVPSAEAADDTLEGALLTATAEEYATGIEILSDVLDTIVNEIGVRSGLVQEAAQPATGTATAVSDGLQPYLLPAGAQLTAVAADQSRYQFVTEQDAVFAAASTPGATVTVTGIPVRATDEGTDSNGLTGPVDPDQAYVWLNSMTLEGPTVDGTDGEDDDAFLNKTTTEMELNSSQVIVPGDFAGRIQSNPAVGGVSIVDLLDPAHPGVETANAMTAFVRDLAGEPLSSGAKTTIAADIASRRETNFGLFIADYTYTTVNVEMTVAAYPAYLGVAQAQVVAALQQWLSPLSWAQPPEDVEAEWWVPSKHVRLTEAVAVARSCEAIAYVVTGTPKIQGTAADLTLSGLAPLTRAGTMTVTVVERVP